MHGLTLKLGRTLNPASKAEYLTARNNDDGVTFVVA
jgi:hypothetical protein